MSLKSRRKWLLPKERKGNVLEHLLSLRDIDDIEAFLNPDIQNIPSPDLLYDTDTAAEEIIKHIEKGSKIVIHGDYDCDGICATSLIWEFLYREVAKFLGKKIEVLPYIPDRIEQGYGLTKGSLKDLVELGVNLVITVDCGVRDQKLINEFRKQHNLDFVVTDHHQPPEDILHDLTYPLVHQMFPGKEYPFQEISGTAVMYLLIQALRTKLGIETNVREGIDLVALSTITDIMPLKGVNRIFVKEGLEEMRKGHRLGLRMLSLRAGIQLNELSAYHLGYILGPRINASGRIASPMDGVKLLVSKDETLCKNISNILEETNFSRQKMTMDILEEARRKVVDSKEKILFAFGENWHEGIIGLVAGKLQEEFYKPVIVCTGTKGSFKGSARSIAGFNITKALEVHNEYLDRYGGHELAAGFTTKEGVFDEFIQKMTEYANQNISVNQLVPELHPDLLLDTEDVTFNLLNEIKKLEPFGYGNSKPLICILNVEIKRKQPLGKEGKHLKLFVKGNGIDYLTVLLFNCNEDTEILNEGGKIDIVGYPDVNVWNGNETLQFNMKEWRFAD